LNRSALAGGVSKELQKGGTLAGEKGGSNREKKQTGPGKTPKIVGEKAGGGKRMVSSQ